VRTKIMTIRGSHSGSVFWLVFFRFKLVRLTPSWGIIFAFFVVHLMLVFLISLRFITPYFTNATVIQRTIQLIPRLPEPTLVTEVLVEEDVPVKKGQPLFQFDRRPYENKVRGSLSRPALGPRPWISTNRLMVMLPMARRKRLWLAPQQRSAS
jgi:hypothetical protein